MSRNNAIDAARAPCERTTSACPECDAPSGSPHAPDCVLRPELRYEDFLSERYALGDAAVYRIAGAFVWLPEMLDPL